MSTIDRSIFQSAHSLQWVLTHIFICMCSICIWSKELGMESLTQRLPEETKQSYFQHDGGTAHRLICHET